MPKQRRDRRDRREPRPAKEADGGHPHLRVRVPKEMADHLQQLANEKYEGNLSILLRKILEHYLRKPFSLE